MRRFGAGSDPEPMSRRRGKALATVTAAILALPAAARAQRARCDWLPRSDSTHSTTENIPGGVSRTFVGGGVLVKCPGRGITLRGDSAEVYQDKYYIIGRVAYDEPRLAMTSDFLTYFPAEERVVATATPPGSVNAKLPSGSTLVGPVAEYRRAIPKTRPRAQILALGRPTITIIQKDSTGKPMPPMTVVAQQVFMDGDSLLYGGGQVSISRPEILAKGDSVFLDTSRETMRLMRTPRIDGKREKPFSLTGELIDLYSRNRKLEHVLSRGKATATSQDMVLKADTIDLRVVNDLLDRAIAWGKTLRAHATSPAQNVTADSIVVSMPQQRVRLIRALRQAFAEAKPDTVRFRVEAPDTTDVIAGDTIVARFDTLPPKDTTKGPSVEQIVATGHAKSQYHFAVNDTAVHRPAISYVRARQITIDFAKASVATVSAKDSVVGLYLEPTADTVRAGAKASGTSGQQRPQSPPIKSVIPLPPRPPASHPQ